MTAATRRWAKTDATQQRILDAATEVFSAHGFTAATMADIVDYSGASIGSIYHHFGGKKDRSWRSSSA
jgi:AcrR family transcriptional regulator